MSNRIGGACFLVTLSLASSVGCGGAIATTSADAGDTASADTGTGITDSSITVADVSNDGGGNNTDTGGAPLNCGSLPKYPSVPLPTCSTDADCVAFLTPYLPASASRVMTVCGPDGFCQAGDHCILLSTGLADCTCGGYPNCGGTDVCAMMPGQSTPQCVPSRCAPN